MEEEEERKSEEEEEEKQDQQDENETTETETEESPKPARALRKTTTLAGKRSAQEAAANSSNNSKASSSSVAPSSSAAGGGIPRRSKARMVEFDVEPIRDQVICRLCEGLYREPYTTIKCFHTFCKSCLATALHSSKYTSRSEAFNACPQCRLYLGRSADPASVALPDRTLETLIDKILFPQLAAQDRDAERAHYRRLGIERKELPSDDQQQQRQDADDEDLADDEDRSTSVRSKSNNNNSKRARSSHNASDASAGGAAGEDVIPEGGGGEAAANNNSSRSSRTVLFQLLPAKTAASNRSSKSLRMQLPFLKTEGSVRVDQLKRYIFQKLHHRDNNNEQEAASNNNNDDKYNSNPSSSAVEILCNLELLPDDMTVAHVEETVWPKSHSDQIMQLTYVWKEPPKVVDLTAAD